VSYLIQFRNDTAQAWDNANPILAAGEAGIDTTNQVFKIGNGVTPWSTLQGISIPAVANATATGTPGIISQFAGATAPPGYLLCDGTAVSRTTYSSLFGTIGTTYGAGNGTTTFNLPNLKGRVPVGQDTAQSEFNVLGETDGAKTVTITEAQMPSHNHSGTTSTNGSHSHNMNDSYLEGVYSPSGASRAFAGNQQYSGWGDTRYIQANGDHSHTITTNSKGSGEAHNNLQPYIVLNYIIKT
jgi:microcystin-dependent protein